MTKMRLCSGNMSPSEDLSKTHEALLGSKMEATTLREFCIIPERLILLIILVGKPVNAINPGLKVNNFSCIKVFSSAYVSCSLRLLLLKSEGQKI